MYYFKFIYFRSGIDYTYISIKRILTFQEKEESKKKFVCVFLVI